MLGDTQMPLETTAGLQVDSTKSRNHLNAIVRPTEKLCKPGWCHQILCKAPMQNSVTFCTEVSAKGTVCVVMRFCLVRK